MYLLYGAMRFADVLTVFVSAALAHTIWFSSGFVTGKEPFIVPWQYYYFAGTLGALLVAIVFPLQGVYVYKVQRVPFGRLRIASLAVAWTIVMLALIVAAFLFHVTEFYSRAWVALWFSVALLLMTTARLARFYIERQWLRSGKLLRRVVVYGSGDNAARLISTLRASGDIGFEIAGFFDERPSQRHHPALARENYLGKIKDLIAYGREHRIDHIIVALPWTAEKRTLEVCRKLRSLPVDIQLAPDFTGFHMINATLTHMGGVALLNVFQKPLPDWHYLIKAAEDRILGLLLLLGFSPLMALIALAIKFDSPGPVLFRQKRYGFNNTLIGVYKFRTMYTHLTDQKAEKLVTKDDPRVTRIGRFLRKTSFDELPQLINVVFGDMSIVGPRPHATNAKAANRLYEEVADEYAARHRVKPGITGWAQVKGWRGETDTEEKLLRRIEHDLYYIDHWSLGLDFKIMAMTAVAIFKAENAY